MIKITQITNKTNITIGIYIFFYIIILIMNFYTPFNGDDYRYAFNYSDWSRIENISDVIESQIVHYQTINGRTVPHVFEQIFVGITGKWLFNIINSFFLIWLIKLITDRLSETGKNKNCLILVSFIASLFLFSYPGQTMFWMAGALNYLWPVTLAFYLFNNFETINNNHNIISLFLISLFSAWFQEAISIVFFISLIVLSVIEKKYRTKKNYAIIIGYFIGTTLIVLSPGTIARLSSNEIVHSGGILFIVTTKLLETFAALKKLSIFWVSVLFIIIMLFTLKRKFYDNNRTYIILWIVNVCFFFLLGFSEERITIFLSIISFIIVVKTLINFINVNFIVFITIFLMSIISSIYGVYKCHDYFTWVDNLQTKIINFNGKKVIIEYDNYYKSSRLIYVEKISCDFNSTSNKAISMYYNKEFIQILNKDLYSMYNSDFINKSKSTDKKLVILNTEYPFYYNRDFNMYFFELKEQFAKQNIEIVYEQDNTKLSKRQIFIRSILNTLDNKIKVKHYILCKNNKYYCFMPQIKSLKPLKLYVNSNNLGYITQSK